MEQPVNFCGARPAISRHLFPHTVQGAKQQVPLLVRQIV